jgi:hypothetical protein
MGTCAGMVLEICVSIQEMKERSDTERKTVLAKALN